MEDLNKNAISDEELDEVTGGAGIKGDKNGTWMYKFDYQVSLGKFVNVVSKEKYNNQAKARRAGTIARMKYMSKKPTKLIVFEQR